MFLILGGGYLVGFHPLFHLLAGTPFLFKLLISLILLCPLCFFMGRPFPMGIALLKGEAEQDIPLAWGFNGFCSVLAASGAVALSMSLGYSWVQILSLCCYAFAGFLIKA